MAHEHHRTKAIFLKKENRAESDQIFTLFTKDFGKIKLIGKAIRKNTSKLRAGAEVFYFSEVEFVQGKHQKILTDALLIEKLSAFPEIAEIIDTLVFEGIKDDRLFPLLVKVLRGQTPQQIERGLTPLYFFWRVVGLLGYKPELYKCVGCFRQLSPKKIFFAPIQGGVVCPACFSVENSEAVEINEAAVKILRFFLAENSKMVKKIKTEAAVIKNLNEITRFYFDFLKEEMHYPQQSS